MHFWIWIPLRGICLSPFCSSDLVKQEGQRRIIWFRCDVIQLPKLTKQGKGGLCVPIVTNVPVSTKPWGHGFLDTCHPKKNSNPPETVTTGFQCHIPCQMDAFLIWLCGKTLARNWIKIKIISGFLGFFGDKRKEGRRKYRHRKPSRLLDFHCALRINSDFSSALTLDPNDSLCFSCKTPTLTAVCMCFCQCPT